MHAKPSPHESPSQRARHRPALGKRSPPHTATAPSSTAGTHEAPSRSAHPASSSQGRVHVLQIQLKAPQSAETSQALIQLVWLPVRGSPGAQPTTAPLSQEQPRKTKRKRLTARRLLPSDTVQNRTSLGTRPHQSSRGCI